eukprot:5691502-Lingulodinium_polyedra.AAC.1
MSSSSMLSVTPSESPPHLIGAVAEKELVEVMREPVPRCADPDPDVPPNAQRPRNAGTRGSI